MWKKIVAVLLRITPAGAGKTGFESSCFGHWQDHPRRCGENLSLYLFRCSLLGSPPQVRGKLSSFGMVSAPCRITPAGAGKTLRFGSNTLCRWDHPRRCGENHFPIMRVAEQTGSPPQVRGKHAIVRTGDNAYRITPAGAGKTLKRSFRNQPFCSRAVQISFNFSNSLNVSLQSGSAR